MKVFTVDLSNSAVSATVAQLAGLPRFRNQAGVYVAADTKAAAAHHVGSLPERWVGDLTVGRLRAATGNDVDSLVAAGLLHAPTILVVAMGGGNRPVVQVTADGPAVIGDLVREDRTGELRFEAVGTLHMTLPPEQLAAVRELLAQVDYSSRRARDLRTLVPVELLEHV